MSVVLWHPRKSRLSTLIDQPGGLSVGVALTQARANLEVLKAESQAIVAARIAELVALRAPAPDSADPMQVLAQAYHLSSAVIDAAGPFERHDLCTAAAGLCDLIDAAPTDHPFDWRVVTVHAQALQLILHLPPEADQARAEVLDNLRLVLEKKIPVYIDQPAN